MPRLNEGIEASGRKGQCVQAEGVSRVSLGLGDLLTAGPDLRGIGGRRGKGADFTVAINHRSPHALTGEQPAHPGSGTKRRADSGAGRGLPEEGFQLRCGWEAGATRGS